MTSSSRGERSFDRWKTQTFISTLRCDGLIAPWGIDCPMNRTTFETQHASTLKPSDVVILGNLSRHKSEKAKAIFKARGCLVPLRSAPAAPTLTRSKRLLKTQGKPRRTGARIIDALGQAIGNICDLYTPDECWNFLKAAGCASDQRLGALNRNTLLAGIICSFF